MDNGSREASEVIRLTMDGIQLMLRVSGTVTNELLEFFAALQKSEGQSQAEDASKLNRMIEKFGLMESVAVETIAEKNSKNDVSQKEGREKEISDAREIISKMLEPTTQEKAIMQMEDGEIPGHIATDIENQFVASSEESEERIILNGIPLEERPSVRERITKIINGNKDDNKENKLRREALNSVIDVGKEQPWKEVKYLRD